MELTHWAHFALSSQEHGRGRICKYWALRGVLVFRLVVERPGQGAVKPSIVTRSGSQFYIFCGDFHVSAQMDVVEAGRFGRLVSLFIGGWSRRFHSTLFL